MQRQPSTDFGNQKQNVAKKWDGGDLMRFAGRRRPSERQTVIIAARLSTDLASRRRRTQF
jgi:hypothetical protein